MATIVNLASRRKAPPLDVELFDDFFSKRAKLFPPDAPHIIEAPDADDEISIPLRTRYPSRRRVPFSPVSATVKRPPFFLFPRKGRRPHLYKTPTWRIAFEFLAYVVSAAIILRVIGGLSMWSGA